MKFLGRKTRRGEELSCLYEAEGARQHELVVGIAYRNRAEAQAVHDRRREKKTPEPTPFRYTRQSKTREQRSLSFSGPRFKSLFRFPDHSLSDSSHRSGATGSQPYGTRIATTLQQRLPGCQPPGSAGRLMLVPMRRRRIRYTRQAAANARTL